MGRGVKIRIGGQNTMGRGLNIPWVGGKIPWVGSSIYHDQGFKIPWVDRENTMLF